QFDFGKFATSAGAEVTETYLDWQYSRGFLYVNGPFYHTGLRTTIPVSQKWTLGYHLINGFNNNVEDNNSGKTQGLTAALTTSKVNWSNAYYFGPEKPNTNQGWRHFCDTVFAINPNGEWRGLLNFDYGQENNPGSFPSRFYGWMGAVR